MKKILMSMFLFIFLLIPAVCLASPAIKYDKQHFDPARGIYYLEGNVSVTVGQRVISADKAQVEMYAIEVHAQGDIHLQQDDIDFYGDTVDVYGSSKTAEVNGNLSFTQGNIAITADSGTFNWGTKNAVFIGNVQATTPNGTLKADKIVYNIRTHEIKN
ncbi:MAG: LptA/OstA family protein [Acidaminococcaceae bacterium]|nr:LptA/OstA family protein [Acidaminococcaceae bacterium]MDD4721631.1 LptA/OstA family protein [Acidaminococcaceae bacterium]